MTLILALKTDKEVYLASDSRSYLEMADKTKVFRTAQKHIKVNDHVEILISGIRELALGFYEKVKRNLWKKGLDEEFYSAFDIADEIEKVVNSSFEDDINTLSKPSFKAALIKEDKSILDFLREGWFPLELIVGGMDKDKNGDFVYPAIYMHEPNLHYKKCKSDANIALGGAPSVKNIAELVLKDFLFADILDSSINYEDKIYSCFRAVIHRIEMQMAENEMSTVGEPIHIARITKEGYETLR